MSDRGDRILTALRNDPELLFEMATVLRRERVASAWMPDPKDHTKRVRRDTRGKTVAIVKRHGTRNINPWEASTTKPETVEERPAKNFMTQGDALDWCDSQLRAQGFTLVGGS